ncbi:hypothetical protein WJ970_22260 [Achromobacter xylosoxidans]
MRTYRVPSDALVAVREGDCDVGLIDDALWEPLMRFPEWKKFSSTLAAEGARAERAWLVSAAAPVTPRLAGRRNARLGPRRRLEGAGRQVGARRGLRRVPGPGSAGLPRLGARRAGRCTYNARL